MYVYQLLHRALHHLYPVPIEVGGAPELDKSYFGSRRVCGKRGRVVGSKTIVFGLFKRNSRVYTEIIRNRSKKTLQGIVWSKITAAAMVNTNDWWGL